MLYQLNTPEKPYKFEAWSLTAAYVVATLLGGGFDSLWQDGKQIMPVFLFGRVEEWSRRVFDMNFTDIVQEISPDEIARIYMTSLVGKAQDHQCYPQEVSMIYHSKGILLNAPGQWRAQHTPTPYGLCRIPDGGAVVQLQAGYRRDK